MGLMCCTLFCRSCWNTWCVCRVCNGCESLTTCDVACLVVFTATKLWLGGVVACLAVHRSANLNVVAWVEGANQANQDPPPLPGCPD